MALEEKLAGTRDLNPSSSEQKILGQASRISGALHLHKYIHINIHYDSCLWLSVRRLFRWRRSRSPFLELMNLRGQTRPTKFLKILDLPAGSTADEHLINRNDSQSVRVLVCQFLRVSVRRSDGLSVSRSVSL